MNERTNLVGRRPIDIAALLAPHVDRDFRGRQVANWIVDRNFSSFATMTNLPLALCRDLDRLFIIAEPEVLRETVASDGSRKYLLGLEDGYTFGGVAMRDGAKATLCPSSQAGCALGCSFCVAGAVGSGRDHGPSEVVGQYRAMLRRLDPGVERVNLVSLGMGEPLLNTSNLGPASRLCMAQ